VTEFLHQQQRGFPAKQLLFQLSAASLCLMARLTICAKLASSAVAPRSRVRPGATATISCSIYFDCKISQSRKKGVA
jgi:hypothetical protein